VCGPVQYSQLLFNLRLLRPAYMKINPDVFEAYLKCPTKCLAVRAQVDSGILESELHAVERVSSEGRGKHAQFIPIRFAFTNKLYRDDALLLAFDALVLSEMLCCDVTCGKIVHGDDHATRTVKTAALADKVRKIIGKMATLLASHSPPDLVLNRHCVECEFRDRCRPRRDFRNIAISH
jgi:hypothetical protein